MVHIDLETVLVIRINVVTDKQVLSGFAEDCEWATEELKRM